MLKRITAILTIALASSACASFSAPTDTMANALSSVRGAEELGAKQVPQAALELQLANDQVAEAERLMRDGDNEEAHYMALRAIQDAELAIALVREDRAQAQAKSAKQDLAKIESEVTP